MGGNLEGKWASAVAYFAPFEPTVLAKAISQTEVELEVIPDYEFNNIRTYLATIYRDGVSIGEKKKT